MGKAGILVAPVTIIVLGLIVWGITKTVNKLPTNVKKLQQKAELADEAMEEFRKLMIVDNLDGDLNYLTEKSKNDIKAWAAKYRRVNS